MKQKVGIIGLGVGEKHIEGYQKHPDCEVVALCDFSDDKLNRTKEKYPTLLSTTNADDIIKDPEINIVSIASYDNYHYNQIVKAINYNKHIFVEKPFCLYEKEARHIRSLLKAKPQLKISSNLILRKSPRFCQLRNEIIEGRLGNIYYVEGDYNYGRVHKITDGWRGKIDFYSVVYGGAIHIIDLLLWLTGESITEVAAYSNNKATKGSQFRYNDTVISILKFTNGLIGKVSSNYSCVYPHFHRLSVYGTKATFENGINQASLYESRDPNTPPISINTDYPGVHKGDLIYSFVNSIVNNTSPDVTEEDIFKSMSICFAIEKASKESTTIPVEYI